MTQKTKQNKVVALEYDRESDGAPRITAKGRGKIGEKIIEIAKKNNIYIHRDPDLIEVLSQLNINNEIPSELYVIVAELLAFVYSLNKKSSFQ